MKRNKTKSLTLLFYKDIFRQVSMTNDKASGFAKGVCWDRFNFIELFVQLLFWHGFVARARVWQVLRV